MEKFVRFLSQSYYTDFIHFLVCITGLIVSIKLQHKHRALKVFRYYFAAFILLKLANWYLVSLTFSRTDFILSDHLDYLFTLFEYACLAFFIKSQIQNPSQRNILSLISVAFYIISASIYFPHLVQNRLPDPELNTVFSVQAICLIISCGFYYIDVIKSAPKKLTDEPSFWIVNGIVFFMLSTLPYSILLNYI